MFILSMSFKYRETVLDELARHGVIPQDDTPPELAHQFVTDLHLFEIRKLKQQMLAGRIPRADYANTVEALRMRYPILSLPARFWIEDE
ncbi:MAG TPA: hypothetical protein VI837_12350 [Blastocatellia bacterium]|nr:hypothetical protein [Blastocatellia bacterium]